MEEYGNLGHNNQDTEETLFLIVKQELDDHLTSSPIEYQKDPLAVSEYEIKSEKKENTLINTGKEEHTDAINEDLKYLPPFEEAKYSNNIKETVTLGTDNILYESLCKDDIKPSTSAYRGDESAKNAGSIYERSKNYECYVCHKTFSLKGYLRIHNNHVHKRIRNYQCNECQKKFYNKGLLQSHISGVHEGIRSYQCYECKKKFSSKVYLQSHINGVHKGIRNFKCIECEKRFFKRSDLQRHISSVHKRIRNFTCIECEKKFVSNRNLQEHISGVHKKIRNFKCTECEKKYLYNCDLQKHIRVVHKEIIKKL